MLDSTEGQLQELDSIRTKFERVNAMMAEWMRKYGWDSSLFLDLKSSNS